MMFSSTNNSLTINSFYGAITASVWARQLWSYWRFIRFLCTTGASRMSYLSSKRSRKPCGRKSMKAAAAGRLLQRTGKNQRSGAGGGGRRGSPEAYFGAYLPQFSTPCWLRDPVRSALLCESGAIVLLVCVPLIPIAIAAVQTWAKKLLSKYWGQYTALGDTFLETCKGWRP